MPIDVHTHMYSDRWLDRLTSSKSSYKVVENPNGSKSIVRGNTPFVSLTPQMFDYETRIRDMDEAGIDMAIVSLTCPNVFWGDEDISALTALESNDDMLAAQETYPDRIRFFASLPWQYPARAVEELKRAHTNGAVGVMVLGNIDGKPLTDPMFAPIWDEINARALPVLIHPTNPPAVDQLNLSKYHLAWSVGFTFDTTLALATLILDGFFERYKSLKIIGSHGGGYLPYLLGRLDAGFDYFPTSAEKIDSKARNHIGNLYLDSIVYDHDVLDFAIKMVGADHMLFGSDYPHLCGNMVDARNNLSRLDTPTKALLESGNAKKLFDL